jgi:two-component system, OmpR family, aerobic respiration control sensor histidine kinase ArcB
MDDKRDNDFQWDATSTLKLIISNMPGYVYWKDIHSRYMGCNNNFAAVSHLKSPDDIVGKVDADFSWGVELAEQFRKDDEYVLQSKTTHSSVYSLPLKNKNGNTIVVRTEKTPLYNAQAHITGILAIATDITEQELLREKSDTLHALTEEVIYHLPGLIYWKNKNSQYMGFNKNVVQLSGLTREELLGKTDFELNWGIEEAASFRKDDEEIMRTGIVKITEHQIPIKRSDGRNIVVRTEKTRLYNKNGDIAGVMAVAIDITDQKAMEAELIAEKEQTEKLSQHKTQIIRNMEHDIRTPFSGVYSLIGALEQKETDQEKKKYLYAISESAKELLNYCNRILEFSQIESGTIPILMKKFDLKALIASVMAIETPSAISRNLDLLWDYPTNLPTIFLGDPFRLQCIMLNLLGNALKFTQTGYVKLSVQLPSQSPDKKFLILRFLIEDTGIGIPKEKQDIIYESFIRLSPSNQNKYKGVGLGLSIVKCFLADLEGEIDVCSTEGNGSIFAFTVGLKRPLLDEILFEQII